MSSSGRDYDMSAVYGREGALNVQWGEFCKELYRQEDYRAHQSRMKSCRLHAPFWTSENPDTMTRSSKPGVTPTVGSPQKSKQQERAEVVKALENYLEAQNMTTRQFCRKAVDQTNGKIITAKLRNVMWLNVGPMDRPVFDRMMDEASSKCGSPGFYIHFNSFLDTFTRRKGDLPALSPRPPSKRTVLPKTPRREAKAKPSTPTPCETPARIRKEKANGANMLDGILSTGLLQTLLRNSDVKRSAFNPKMKRKQQAKFVSKWKLQK